jgi:hypothetical protein
MEQWLHQFSAWPYMTVAIRLQSLYAVYTDFDRRMGGPQEVLEKEKFFTCVKSKADSFTVKPIP